MIQRKPLRAWISILKTFLEDSSGLTQFEDTPRGTFCVPYLEGGTIATSSSRQL